ncbi:MAG: FG-GAP-like repeat-containing protein [Acidimicrobiales bacterium]
MGRSPRAFAQLCLAALSAGCLAWAPAAPSPAGAAPPSVPASFTSTSVPVGDGAWAAELGDVDGDGALDVVAVNRDLDTVSVALGQGNGSFAAHVQHATGDQPASIALADVDADDDVDIVTADAGAAGLSVLLGAGDGSFAPRTAVALGITPRRVVAGDVDGDSDVDLAVATFSGTSLVLGNGDGTFAAATEVYAPGGGSKGVALGDVDGDLTLDLISADGTANVVSVLLGDGVGGFALAGTHATGASGSSPEVVTTADLDGDGDLDLVAANAVNTVAVLLGAGDGTFAARATYTSGLVPMDVAVADLNGDAIPDLATADLERGLTVLLGDSEGDGTFGAEALFCCRDGRSVALGDLNGDAFADVALMRNTPFGASPDTVGIFVNTAGLALATPTAAAGSAGVTVSWSPPPAPAVAATVTGYVVTPHNGTSPLAPRVFSSSATSQVITGLTNGTTYTFKVAASNAFGAGPRSASSNAVTSATGLLAPTIGTATAAVNGTATVSWTPPAADGGAPVTGYIVSSYIGLFPWPPAQLFTSTATTQTVAGLTNGTQYRFRVQAVNSAATSNYSGATNAVTPVVATVPGSPTGAAATPGNGQATISWTAPTSNGGSPITGYWVTGYVGYFPVALVRFGSTSTSQVMTGLTNGTTYWFRVRAVNAVGGGTLSGPTSLVTPTA